MDLIGEGYIPLDKSWMIRMGVLDMVHGLDDITTFLEKQDALGDDLQALLQVSKRWHTNDTLQVGESGTLYRFLKFASWYQDNPKVFLREGTLGTREICNDHSIINWSQEQLLTLDNGTSQWASAKVLMGDGARLEQPPYKLALTYEAQDHWNSKRSNRKCWNPRYDDTILNQAAAFVHYKKTGEMHFTPLQSEDYCFARAFDIISPEEGEQLWPSLRGHESDRIAEMEQELQGNRILSKDHRVVQATTMAKDIPAKYPNAVNKTWPQFWKFLEQYA